MLKKYIQHEKMDKVSSEKKVFLYGYVFTASISVKIKSQKQKHSITLIHHYVLASITCSFLGLILILLGMITQ